MVDYDTAVAAVQDPNADPAFLAKIAYENPEFGANVAAHQRAYPYTNPADLSEVADYAEPVQEQPQPQPQQPIARNPYGFTAQMALTTTDQMQIAQIAQYAPELRACIARNPNTYPALLEWLAQLNDPAINAALRTRQ